MLTRHATRKQAETEFRKAYAGLILKIFRLNSDILDLENAIGPQYGLKSSSWQVLGTISSQSAPLPVAHLARIIGVTRQAIQRTVNELVENELVTLESNQHHRRAPLVVMTDAGSAAYQAASDRHWVWVRSWMKQIDIGSIQECSALLETLHGFYDTALS